MKHSIKTAALATLAAVAMQATSCKKKENPETAPATTTVTTDTAEPAAEPVTIAPDDTLQSNVRDAVKDFPGVTASVADGEVTLTGTIKRDRLTELMQHLHGLHPKKINNNLTINN
jgi:osmotically-inducible protein OsmY